MLGDSVRPDDLLAPEWRPIGAAAFNPLRAGVQDVAGRTLGAAEIATLPAGDIAPGETVLEGAVNLWRGRLLAAGARIGHARLLASAAGVGGQTI
jgi:hypothetical protein